MTITEEEKIVARAILKREGSCAGSDTPCSVCFAHRLRVEKRLRSCGDLFRSLDPDLCKAKVLWFKRQLTWEQEDI